MTSPLRVNRKSHSSVKRLLKTMEFTHCWRKRRCIENLFLTSISSLQLKELKLEKPKSGKENRSTSKSDSKRTEKSDSKPQSRSGSRDKEVLKKCPFLHECCSLSGLNLVNVHDRARVHQTVKCRNAIVRSRNRASDCSFLSLNTSSRFRVLPHVHAHQMHTRASVTQFPLQLSIANFLPLVPTSIVMQFAIIHCVR